MKSLTIATAALLLHLVVAPIVYAETAPREISLSRVSTVLKTDKTCGGKLDVGQARVITTDGEHQLIIPVKNLLDRPLTVAARTSFIGQDGNIMVEEKPAGGFEGIARGFIGVVSLGMSEAAMQEREGTSSVITMQEVAPGKIVEVVHTMPTGVDSASSVNSTLSVVPSSQDLANQRDIRRQFDMAFQGVRERYVEQRRGEFNRWYALKDEFQARKSSFAPLSEDYKQLMADYWSEHREHMERLDQIEQGFAVLEAKQQQMVNDALAQAESFTN